MAAAKEFGLRVLSAERSFYEGKCVSLTLPGEDGRFGVLARHSPMVAAVVPGTMTCRLPDGRTLTAAVGGGFVRVAANDVLVLVDSAAPLP